MREILFRGKRIDNGEWVEGDLRQDRDFLYTFIDGWDYCVGETGLEREPFIDEVIPETVGQYTGLTDKNGVKIFEGDIVDASSEWWDACGSAGHDSPIIIVEWDEGVCGFAPFAIYDCDCDVYINADGCEVIGNIHDNPELVEVG